MTDAAPALKNLTVEDARARMLAGADSLGVETVELTASLNRILALPVDANRHQPPFDASAMDGWAVRREDVVPGAVFAIVGESAAGRAHAGTVQAGQAVRIFTGAPVPAGADMVVIQENAVREGQTLRFTLPERLNSNIRLAGGDFKTGERLLEAGLKLDPWRLSLAAAAGCGTLEVHRRPRVAILATGDELVAPGQTPADDQIFESGSFGLAALVEAWGGEAIRLKAQGDSVEAIAAAVSDASVDLVVTIGGASVGDYDLVKPALATLGLSLKVETIAIRPGKPTWFGDLSDGRRVLGLPGNPASALVCAELFLRPLIAALSGADPALTMIAARLARPLPGNGPRAHWMRASLEIDAQGQAVATPFGDQDSSLIGVFSRANALMTRPAHAEAAEAGDLVQVLPLGRA